MRAMIVDISKSLTGLLCQHLANQKVQTIGETQGLAALQMLQQVQCDLICVALHLEDMNGVEFLKQLRQIPAHKSTQVFLLTSSADSQLLDEATRAGANEIFQKNNVASLLERVTHWCQNHQAAS